MHLKPYLFFIILFWLNLSSNSFAQDLLVSPFFNSLELKGIAFYNLLEDKRGFLWIGSDRGVFRYDGTHIINYTTEQGLLSKDVFDIHEDKQGRIWFSMYEKGLTYYDYELDSIIVPKWNHALTKELKGSWVDGFIIDKDSTFWVQKFTFSPYVSIDLFAIKNDRLTTYKLTQASQLDSLINIQTKEISVQKFFKVIQIKLRFPNSKVHTIAIDDSSFLSLNNSVLEYETPVGAKSLFRKLNNGYKKLVQLPNKQLLLLGHHGFLKLIKSDTNIYLSQYQINDAIQLKNGLYVFSTNTQGLLMSSSIDIESVSVGLDKELVLAIEKQKDYLYIRTNHAIYKTHRQPYQTPELISQINDASFSRSPNAFFVWKDWILSNKTLLHKNLQPIDPKILYNFLKDRNIYKGREKSLTAVGDSLLIKTTAKGFFLLDTTLNTHTNSQDLGFSDWTYTATQVSPNELWLGTMNGLVSYNLTTKTITEIPLATQHLTVQYLTGSHENRVFAGSRFKGLFVFPFSSDQPIIINTEDKLNANDVRSILIENDSTTWVGTSNGINKVVFEANTNNYKVYSYLTGHLIHDMSLLGDSLFAVTDAHLLVFHKNISPINKSYATFYLTQLTTNGKKQLPQQDSPIQLQPDQNNIRINFTQIDFEKVNPTIFCYALVANAAVDTNWQYTQDYAVNYSDLTPQTYTFLLTTKEELTKANPKTIALVIDIQPRFIDTLYFQLLIYFLIFLSISIVAFIIILVIKRRIDLKRALVESELKLLRTQMNPHFIFNALNSILGHITMQDLWTSTMYLSSFADLVRQVLENSRYSFLPLQEEIEMLKLYTELEKLRLGDNYNITIEVTDNSILTNFQIPPMLIQPFIENAIIHGVSPNEFGTISISFNKKNEQFVEIIIKDNGIGRAANAKINRSFGTYKKTSFGIANVRERIMIIRKTYGVDIQFSIKDLEQAGQACGTAVHILLPKFALTQNQ